MDQVQIEVSRDELTRLVNALRQTNDRTLEQRLAEILSRLSNRPINWAV